MKAIKPTRPYPADPIAEIRQIRDELAAEHGYDLHSLVAALRKEQGKSGHKVVDLSRQPRAISRRKAAASV